MNIVKRAIITEKTLKEAKRGIFAFEVDLKAQKNIIKKKIEEMFSVHVKKIRTEILKGKRKVFGKKRISKKMPDMKKARVHLEKGEKIAIFDVGKTT